MAQALISHNVILHYGEEEYIKQVVNKHTEQILRGIVCLWGC